MPRSVTKVELLTAARRERAALEKALAGLTPEELVFSPAPGVWSVKDVLAHLIEWEQMVLSWVETGCQGQTPAIPAAGYKWNQLPALNQKIYEKHRERPLAEILTEFEAAHQRSLAAIESFSEEALFTRGYYPWSGNNALAAYFNSSTASHYLWARKEIQKLLKAK